MAEKRGKFSNRIKNLKDKKIKKILSQKLPKNKSIKLKKIKNIRKKIKKKNLDFDFIKNAPAPILLPEQNLKKKFSIKNLFNLKKSNKENSDVHEQNLIKKFRDFEDKQKDYIETDLDKLVNFVNQVEAIKLSTVTKLFNISLKKAEEWAKILDSHNIVRLHYPGIGEPELRKWKK